MERFSPTKLNTSGTSPLISAAIKEKHECDGGTLGKKGTWTLMAVRYRCPSNILPSSPWGKWVLGTGWPKVPRAAGYWGDAAACRGQIERSLEPGYSTDTGKRTKEKLALPLKWRARKKKKNLLACCSLFAPFWAPSQGDHIISWQLLKPLI